MGPAATPTRTWRARRASTEQARGRLRLALPYWLSGGLAVLLVIASVAGLFVHGLYRDAPDWIAQARGSDLVTLAVAVPTLLASRTLSARGSPPAQVVQLGVLGYILYMYMIYAFDVVFNPLFLVYLAALSLALWSLVALLTDMDPAGMRAHFTSNLPARTIGGYLVGIAALFCLVWLKDIVPATLGNTSPAGLLGLKLPTNPVHVLDLSVLLPLAALGGILLWQHRPWGYLLAGVILTTMTIVGLSVVSGMLFEYGNDPKTSLGAAPLLTVVTLAGLWLLVLYLRCFRPGPEPGIR